MNIIVNKNRTCRFVVLVIMLISGLSTSFADDRDSIFHSDWSKATCWFQSGDAIDNDKVDFFYITSTNVGISYYPDGSPSPRAVLNADEIKLLAEEDAYVCDSIGRHDFNFFAPFYHQYNFYAINGTKRLFQTTDKAVAEEVYEAFEYYMKHQNNGRRFILAGFSQGASMVTELLKRLTDEEYQRMVAAYVIGYRLTAKDLRCPHIKAAKKATDTKVAISFNSAFSRKAQWAPVSAGSKACINPVNWRTDATPASFSYEGTPLTVYVDQKTHTLIVDGDRTAFHAWMKKHPFLIDAGASIDNLHHWDLLFYTRQIHDNALLRSK